MHRVGRSSSAVLSRAGGIGGRADVRVHMIDRVLMIGSMSWPIPSDFETAAKVGAGNAWLLARDERGELHRNVAQPTLFAPSRSVIWGDIQVSSASPAHLAWEVSVSSIK